MSRTLGRHLVLVSGAALVVLVFAAALLAPLLAPQEHAAQTLDRRLEAPSGEHPLGLDELGRDILSRMLWGARVSLGVGLAVVVLAGGLGTLIGAVAGFVGGKVDGFLMRACDVRLPARLTRADLDFTADALLAAIAEVMSEKTQAVA